MRVIIKHILIFIRTKKNQLLSIILLFVIFGILKSIVYLAPLLLNSILNNVVLFGQFEYALNIGQTCSSFMALGLPSAYAFYVYKHNEIYLKPIFHIIIVGVNLLLFIFAFIPGFIENINFNSFVIGVVLSNQLFIATYYKLFGNSILSVVIDCGLYILLLIFILLLYFNIMIFDFKYWNSLLLIYCLFLCFKYHLPFIVSKQVFTINELLKIFNYSSYIVLTLFLTSLLNTSTRIYIEYFINYSNVGFYSFYIRIASAIIIFHRVIIIFLFKRIYTESHSKLDRYFALIVAVAMCTCILMFFLIPYILSGVSYFANSYIRFKNLYLFSLFQAVSWSTVALLELIIFRENLLKKYVLILGLCLFVMFFSMALISHFCNLRVELLLWINVLFILLLAFCQLMLLEQNGYHYYLTIIIQFVVFSLFLFSGFILLRRF